MDLELLARRDGTIHLSYWDLDRGKDRIFILLADGQAFEEVEDDVNTPVNLAAELHKMALAEELL